MNTGKLFSMLWIFSIFCVSLFSELSTPILHYETIPTEENLGEVHIFLKFDSPNLERLHLTGIAYNKYQNSDELKKIEDALKDSLSRINDNEERQTSEFEYTLKIGEEYTINHNTQRLQLQFSAEANGDSNTTEGAISLNLNMEGIKRDLKRKKDAQHELSSLKKTNLDLNETNSKLKKDNLSLNARLTKISDTTNATVTWSLVKTHEGIFINAESPIEIKINVEAEIIGSNKPITKLNRNSIEIPRLNKKPIFAFSLDKELSNYDLKLKLVEDKKKENMSRIIKFIPEYVEIESGEMPEPRIEEIKGGKPIIKGNKQLKLPIQVLGASRILFGIIENEKDRFDADIPFKIIPLNKKYIDYTKFVSLDDFMFDVELKPKQKYSVYVQPLSECQEEKWKKTSKKRFEIEGHNQILSDEIVVTFGTNTINFMAKTDEEVKLYVTPNPKEISDGSITQKISKNAKKDPSHDLYIADIFKERKDGSAAIPINILLKTEDGSNREQKLTISLKIAQISTENLPKKLKASMKELIAYYEGDQKTSVKKKEIDIRELVETGIGGLLGLIFPRF